MDVIFLFTGAICLVESIMMFMGKDLMIFNETTFKKEDYDMKRLSKAEGILFLVDGLACVAMGALTRAFMLQMILIGVVFVTLFIHGRNFGTSKYRIKKK